MVNSMSEDDISKVGKNGNLDGLTASLKSDEIKDLDVGKKKGILDGLGADYLKSEGGGFDEIIEKADAASIEFVGENDVEADILEDIPEDSGALSTLKNSLSFLVAVV